MTKMHPWQPGDMTGLALHLFFPSSVLSVTVMSIWHVVSWSLGFLHLNELEVQDK